MKVTKFITPKEAAHERYCSSISKGTYIKSSYELLKNIFDLKYEKKKEKEKENEIINEYNYIIQFL
ncbi:hypothetical protein PFMALIP_05731 [Plasmodium falciparum MaliPS096_E11]|uniref:Uncharacterized protein n=1 Tax=Plasmodium falciparum MaliPS096_E11 TaxID=1036727 RepID=A0A024WG77_PLAFA|nr:hypothetical protein PFMALIP_05731 [Plasmodium falciparum MaliPS096_E11]